MAAEYRTIQGDVWDNISFKVYGTVSFMPLLMSANPSHAATTFFNAGVILTIPDQPAESPDDLPPWKRVDLE